jgi:peptidoglycan/xylan/chitin deacetylase (PgdA/CDA1 family)
MRRPINILMYHQVGEFAPMRTHRATYCDHRRFASQMAWLARWRYTVLSMDEVVACLRGERPTPERAVALTFDDGYENFYAYAYPVLARHGFPSMVYLISGMLGRPATWFAADGRDTPPLMSAARIRELRKAGVDFGSHTRSHVKLAQQGEQRMRDELTRSKAELEDVLGERVDHFCYPYGSHDRRTLDAVAAAGYLSASTCVRAPATSTDSPLALPRKAIAHGDNLVGFLWRLHVKNRPRRAAPTRPGSATPAGEA